MCVCVFTLHSRSLLRKKLSSAVNNCVSSSNTIVLSLLGHTDHITPSKCTTTNFPNTQPTIIPSFYYRLRASLARVVSGPQTFPGCVCVVRQITEIYPACSRKPESGLWTRDYGQGNG